MENKNIPSAKKIYHTVTGCVLESHHNPDIEKAMIEFAKLHVTAALEKASEKVIMKDLNEDCHYEDEDGSFPDFLVIDSDSILTSYPLENIQ